MTHRLPFMSAINEKGFVTPEEVFDALVHMSDDEFDDMFVAGLYTGRLLGFELLDLTTDQIKAVNALSDSDFDVVGARLRVVKEAHLSAATSATTVTTTTTTKQAPLPTPAQLTDFLQPSSRTFISSPVYRQSSISKAIAACIKNFKEWGKLKWNHFKIEFVFPSLGKQCHTSGEYYCSLLDTLYLGLGAADANESVHPFDASIMESSYPILSQYFKPLLDDGTIPALSSNPKLFFSTPHIADGAWLQFHGPGTDIFALGGPSFHLVLGALCPKGKKGSFMSLDSWFDQQWKSNTETSEYQISIKWE